MKGILKGFCKLILSLFSILLVILLLVGTWFGIKGYQMYRDPVEEVPISEKAASIRSAPGFTEYEDLPTLYVEAVISVEDKRFWSHHGVDYLAIARAAWNDVRSLSFVEGGSTITQQLMKNQYFTQDKNFERKFAEIFAAWDMEREYTKEEIFELYVNTIYFGSGYYGIHDAAQGYFGKDPAGLTESEAVMLAGLPNAPSVYSLDANPALACQRMRQVLDSMVDCGAISQTESDRIFAGA